MKVGIVGCGWAFDVYMQSWDRHPQLEIAGIADIDHTRLGVVGRHYGLSCYATNEALFADPDVDIVANLTPPPSHYAVTKAALNAGKHVYSEKPLTTDLAQARELLDLAEAKGLHLSCAPSNVLGDSAQTMWKAVRAGAVGDVRLVYAELDSNPLYLMHPETGRSRSGAPFPWLHELEMGCTWEHAGYALSWMCAMFGPVHSVTAFSKLALPDKTDSPLDLPDTPDFSVGCLDFHSGVVGRLTCSIGAPYDHRLRVIGNKGMLTADTYRHYRCPIYLETFTKLPLKGHLLATVRNSTSLQRLFGVGGRRLDLVRNPSPETDCPPPRKVVAPQDVVLPVLATSGGVAGQVPRNSRTGWCHSERAAAVSSSRFHLPRHRTDARHWGRWRNPLAGIELRAAGAAGRDVQSCTGL